MTRRGSLVYYLAAIVVGCFFLAGLAELRQLGKPLSVKEVTTGLVFWYFFGLIYASSTVLIFAFLLRRVTSWLGLKSTWLWIGTGAAVSIASTWTLGSLGNVLLFRPGPQALLWLPLYYAVYFALMAPAVFVEQPLWLPLWLPAVTGALTAAVLHRIHRAFETSAEPKS